MHLPIGSEEDFLGVVDLVTNQSIIWKDDKLGAEYEYGEVPEDLKDKVEEYRASLIELVVESDDELMEKYLSGEGLSTEEIRKCVRKGVLKGLFIPVFCGSAFKNKGVQPLLDVVVDYLPSPVDIHTTKGLKVLNDEEIEVKSSDEGKLCALAFKVMNDPFVGTLTFVRIYSGVLKSGMTIQNTIKDKKERVGRMLLMHANNREDVKECFAGDIVAIAGLKATSTGDTLCEMGYDVILEKNGIPRSCYRGCNRAKDNSGSREDVGGNS
jgi:elongation factor G